MAGKLVGAEKPKGVFGNHIPRDMVMQSDIQSLAIKGAKAQL